MGTLANLHPGLCTLTLALHTFALHTFALHLHSMPHTLDPCSRRTFRRRTATPTPRGTPVWHYSTVAWGCAFSPIFPLTFAPAVTFPASARITLTTALTTSLTTSLAGSR